MTLHARFECPTCRELRRFSLYPDQREEKDDGVLIPARCPSCKKAINVHFSWTDYKELEPKYRSVL